MPYQTIKEGIATAKTTSIIEIVLSEDSATIIVGVKADTDAIKKRIFDVNLL